MPDFFHLRYMKSPRVKCGRWPKAVYSGLDFFHGLRFKNEKSNLFVVGVGLASAVWEDYDITSVFPYQKQILCKALQLPG